MKILCTYCSRKKNVSEDMLPAYKRYIGKHIKKVHNIAKDRGIQYYILSGKFGLIVHHQEIEWYDYLLKCEDVSVLISRLQIQIKEKQISSIDYYTESLDQEWNVIPYFCAIKEACYKLDVGFKPIIFKKLSEGDILMPGV